MPAPSDIYPLATALGIAIPLDVASPKGTVQMSVGVGVGVPVTLPDAANLCSVYFDADVELWVETYAAVATGTYKSGCIVLLAGIVYDLLLPQSVLVYGHSKAAVGHINVLVTWAQLQNTSNYEVS